LKSFERIGQGGVVVSAVASICLDGRLLLPCLFRHERRRTALG